MVCHPGFGGERALAVGVEPEDFGTSGIPCEETDASRA